MSDREPEPWETGSAESYLTMTAGVTLSGRRTILFGVMTKERFPAPSQVTEEFWVAVTAPAASRGPATARAGKWLIYTPVADHDAVWRKICAATEAGNLGCAAKAATARPNPLRATGRDLVTCVYTRDFEDHADIRRVLAALRRLGFNGRLAYKTDAATHAGMYGAGVAAYVAQPNSLDFEDRRHRLWPPFPHLTSAG